MVTAEALRYTKTSKGADEIGQRRNNLRGKMRTMLILVDPAKTADQLREQAVKIGVDPGFLDAMLRDGYITPVGAPSLSVVGGTTHVLPRAQAPAASAPSPASQDEFGRFREAKAFMNETIVDALGIRAFMFTLKLERCSTRPELVQLVPDYAKGIRKASSPEEAHALTERMNELLTR